MSAFEVAFEAMRNVVGDVEADRLLVAVENEKLREAADRMAELLQDTPEYGPWVAEQIRAMATPASAPIESAGDETGEAPHRFEKEYQGESDAKRRLARCKHCHGSRDDDVHTTGGVS